MLQCQSKEGQEKKGEDDDQGPDEDVEQSGQVLNPPSYEHR